MSVRTLPEPVTRETSSPLRGGRRLWIGAIVLITIGAVAAVAVDGLKYRFVAKRFGVVVPGEVYRSGQLSKWMFEPTVEKHGIGVVIDLNGVDPADEHQAAEIVSYDRIGLEHHRFQLSGDGTGDVETYAAAVAKLAERHRAGETVLVHCSAGAQRTGSVVACYRVLVLGQDPREAYAELARYGWDPDEHQILLTYLNGNMRRVAERLVDRGVIDRVPDPLPVVEP